MACNNQISRRILAKRFVRANFQSQSSFATALYVFRSEIAAITCPPGFFERDKHAASSAPDIKNASRRRAASTAHDLPPMPRLIGKERLRRLRLSAIDRAILDIVEFHDRSPRHA